MIHNRRIVALVPIKEHSARITEKNFKEFCGKPLYQHILNTLERTYAVDEVLIDTDSHRVMHEAPALFRKVKVIERPEELRGDFVSMNKIIAHDTNIIDADIYLQTHATNPLLKAETIAKALKAFTEDEEHDSLFSVNAYHSRFFTADGEPVNHDPRNLIRTQDLPPVFEENSCLYIFTKESFNNTVRRIGRNPRMYETPKVESIDIDDLFAFRLAELLAGYAAAGES